MAGTLNEAGLGLIDRDIAWLLDRLVPPEPALTTLDLLVDGEAYVFHDRAEVSVDVDGIEVSATPGIVTDPMELAPGPHTLTPEIWSPFIEVLDITCSDDDGELPVTITGDSAELEVTEGASVTCTFDLARDSALIGLGITGPIATASTAVFGGTFGTLDVAVGPGTDGDRTVEVPVGSHTANFSHITPSAHLMAASASCDDGTLPDNSLEFSFTLGTHDTVNCTYALLPSPRVSVTQLVLGDVGSAYKVAIRQDAAEIAAKHLASGITAVFTDLPTGNLVVAGTPSIDPAFSQHSCTRTGGRVDGTVSGPGVIVGFANVQLGERIECSILTSVQAG